MNKSHSVKSNILFILFIAVFIFASCKQEWIKVTFPDNIPDETEQYIQNHEYTVLLCIDSTECSPCVLNFWKPYKRVLEKYDTGILLIIRNSDEQVVINILKSLKVVFHFIIDKEEKFKAENKIFKSVTDNIFVIDKNKNVIFSESPIKNEQTWGKFMKIIRKK
jgi:hypothetical protein